MLKKALFALGMADHAPEIGGTRFEAVAPADESFAPVRSSGQKCQGAYVRRNLV